MVKFMSPSNKLKVSHVDNDVTIEKLTKATLNGEKYKITKKLAIDYSLLLLKNTPTNIEKLQSYTKKDDLADCLLQACYFISGTKKIPIDVVNHL